MKRNRVFSPSFKAAAVQRMQAGESPSALSRELNVRRKLLYEWRDRVLAGQPLRRAGRPKKGPDTEPPADRTADRVKGAIRGLEAVKQSILDRAPRGVS